MVVCGREAKFGDAVVEQIALYPGLHDGGPYGC